MFLSPAVLLAALVGIAHAQTTPSGFTPAANMKLEVLFNSTAVNTPGQMLSKAQTASQPQLAISSSAISSNATYMFVMLDLDVPGSLAGGGSSSGNASSRRVLLHALTTGFKPTQQKLSSSSSSSSVILLAASNNNRNPAPYIAPSPPPTDTIPHRYVQLLFQQPAQGVDVTAADFANTSARIGFDVGAFVRRNGVGEPVAGNFFRVDGRVGANGMGTATATATATASGGIARNTLQPFEGGAGRRGGVDLGVLGALVGALAVWGL